MEKFVTFVKKDDKSPNEAAAFASVNMERIFGFVIHKAKSYIAVKFIGDRDQQSFVFIRKCLPTEDIMKALNQKILSFIKSEKESVLDLDSVFAGLVIGKRSRF
ncbi:MAG: hypothetical protein LBC64_05850 [Fibromonadaceae bacterium]|jgi:hypothetical protein|nr:hypothetical protein [Fibromonadaceae bacterium]